MDLFKVNDLVYRTRETPGMPEEMKKHSKTQVGLMQPRIVVSVTHDRYEELITLHGDECQYAASFFELMDTFLNIYNAMDPLDGMDDEDFVPPTDGPYAVGYRILMSAKRYLQNPDRHCLNGEPSEVRMVWPLLGYIDIPEAVHARDCAWHVGGDCHCGAIPWIEF